MNSIEDLRVKINDIGDIFVSSNDSVNSKFNDLSKEIKKKMDSSNIDCIISKIQNVLKKIQLTNIFKRWLDIRKSYQRMDYQYQMYVHLISINET